jgi:hypothetical protein
MLPFKWFSPQSAEVVGSGSAQRIRMEFSRAGRSEISRLWDTGLVHTTSSGLREVPDFIELMALARQSLPALRAKSNVSTCSGLSAHTLRRRSQHASGTQDVTDWGWTLTLSRLGSAPDIIGL